MLKAVLELLSEAPERAERAAQLLAVGLASQPAMFCGSAEAPPKILAALAGVFERYVRPRRETFFK